MMKRIQDTEQIYSLYSKINNKITVHEFHKAIEYFWLQEHKHRKYTDKIRLSSGPCKKLMDEVMPVFRFLKFHGIDAGLICFPLDNQPPDCLLWECGGASPRQIEVTVALARSRFHDASELNAQGEIHRAYTTDEKLLEMIVEIKNRLKRKNNNKYLGMDLLISGPLSVENLPRERWQRVPPAVIGTARLLPFREVHLIGNDSKDPISFRIK